MRISKLLIISLLGTVCLLGGCARAARDTTGFAMVDSTTVDKPFVETWQATKAVLREMELNLYTRDKRGTFVAFSDMKRQLHVFTPHRTKLTITLEEVSSDATKVTVETLDQVYGVTLLTYPDWHDRKTQDNQIAASILENLRAKLAS